jgi:hypothetical protein
MEKNDSNKLEQRRQQKRNKNEGLEPILMVENSRVDGSTCRIFHTPKLALYMSSNVVTQQSSKKEISGVRESELMRY